MSLDVTYDFDFYASTLDGFLDALDTFTTNLVVHDLRGPVGMYWAVRNPRRVHNIVLLNTLVYPETTWAVKLFLLALRTPGLRDYIVNPKGIIGAMKLGVVRKERLTREVLTPYRPRGLLTIDPSRPSPREQTCHRTRQTPFESKWTKTRRAAASSCSGTTASCSAR